MSYGSIGTEWQYWLLFYSIPVLKGVLPSVYFVHYCALVCAISILLSNDISEMELARANVLLCQFYSHVTALYGRSSRYTTMKSCIVCDAGVILLAGAHANSMNIHLLKHLTDHVKNWGPLWSYSCFGFESVNGDVKKLFHGTRDMSEQVNTIIVHNQH